jgi:hypothetical protein
MWKNEVAILYCDGSAWTKVAGKSIQMAAGIYVGTGQTVSNTTWTRVQANTSLFDDTGFMSDAANYKVQIKRTSKYNISGVVTFAGDAAGTTNWSITLGGYNLMQGGVQKNATDGVSNRVVVANINTANTSSVGGPSFNGTVSLTDGDYLSLMLFVSVGSITTMYYVQSSAGCAFTATEVLQW